MFRIIFFIVLILSGLSFLAVYSQNGKSVINSSEADKSVTVQDSTKKTRAQRKLEKQQAKLREQNQREDFAEDLSIYDWNTPKHKKKKVKIDPLHAPVSNENKQKAQFYYARAQQKLDLSDLSGTQNFLSKAIKLWPGYTEAYVMRAEVYGKQKNFWDAIQDYTNVISLDSLNPNYFYNRASCGVQIGDRINAIQDFTIAINLDDKYLLAYEGRAASRSYVGDQAGAIDDYTSVIDINQYFIPAYEGRGVSMYALGDYNNAIADFSFIISMNDSTDKETADLLTEQDAFAYYYLGISKIAKGEMVDGCLNLEKSAQLNFQPAIEELKKSCD